MMKNDFKQKSNEIISTLLLRKINQNNNMARKTLIKQTVKWVAPILTAALIQATSVSAQDGESIFKSKCSACHSIGNGKFVGPDLKDVTTRRKEDWLLKFIKGSQAFVKEDATAKALFAEFNVVMPDFPMSDAEIKSILTYIDSKSAPAKTEVATADSGKQEAAPTEVLPDKSNFATAEEIELGRQLFEGSVAFKNGGASCKSCHNVDYPLMLKGGVLAKDLTTSYSRLGGDAGVSGIMASAPFPAMMATFKDKPLTEKEIYLITAFLNKADKLNGTVAENSGSPLLMGGITVLCCILAGIWLTWIYRKQKMVKQSIYDRQTKTIITNH